MPQQEYCRTCDNKMHIRPEDCVCVVINMYYRCHVDLNFQLRDQL